MGGWTDGLWKQMSTWKVDARVVEAWPGKWWVGGWMDGELGGWMWR